MCLHGCFKILLFAHFIPAACKAFLVKVICQLLYGVSICIFTKFDILKAVQSKFIRPILTIPRSTKNAVLQLEANLVSVSARAWFCLLNFWFKLIFFFLLWIWLQHSETILNQLGY